MPKPDNDAGGKEKAILAPAPLKQEDYKNKIVVNGVEIEWDTKKGTCTFRGIPVALMWVDSTLAGLMAGVASMVGPERFNLALQAEGRKSVESDWLLISRFPDFREGFAELNLNAAVAAWGDWQLITVDHEKQECVFRAYNNWEGMYQKSLGVCWGSGMLAGKLSGICSKLFKTNCWATQTSFVAKGAAYDEFHVARSRKNVEEEIEKLLTSDKATRADMAVALVKLESTEKVLREEIIERKKAEEELQAASLYTRSLIEASQDPLVTISVEGKITDVNEATVRVTGATREALVGSDFAEYFTEPDKARAGYKEVFAKGFVKDYPLTLRHVAGELTDVLYNASVYRDLKGEVVGVVAAARDITKRKKAELEREQYFKFFKTSSDIMVIADPNGCFKQINPGGLAMLGYAETDILARPFIEFVHPDDRQSTLDEMARQLRRGFSLNFENRYICKDGSFLWLSWTANYNKDEGLTYATARDITKRKAAEEALREAVEALRHKSEMLEHSNKELEQFAYVSSHDLQEPLRTITSYVQLLEYRYKSNLDAKADTYIEFITVATHRMQALINDLLQLSRVGTRGKPFTRVQTGKLVDDLIAMHNIQNPGATIIRGQLPDIVADEMQVMQIFQNLIGNAVKFHGVEPPMIHVGASESDAEWTFWVKDNGIGIEPKYFDKIFVVFQRLHTQDEYAGTGIGLALVKKEVERHGGRIWVESEPGKGSAFRFTISKEPRKPEGITA